MLFKELQVKTMENRQDSVELKQMTGLRF